MNNIIVEYDGVYPVACMGTLKITINDDVIYEKKIVPPQQEAQALMKIGKKRFALAI